MKILFLTILAVLIMSSAVLGFGLEWSAYINPENIWINNGEPCLSVNTPMVIEIRVQNPDAIEVMGYNLNLKIYGSGGLASVVWNDAGQITYGPSFEPSIAIPGACETWYHILNPLSWDGALPDTLCHGFIDLEACFPMTADPVTIYELHLTLPTFLEGNHLDVFEGGELCLNAMIDDALGDCNWLFAFPSHFNGPVCWDVEATSCGPAYFVSGPDTIIYTSGQPFSGTFEFTVEAKGCEVISLVLSDYGTATVIENPKEPNILVNWTFDPVLPYCEWLDGENKVDIIPCGAWGCGVGKTVVLVFPSEPPVMENGCGASYYVEPELEHVYQLLATDPEDVGILNWYVVSAVPEPAGDYSITREGEFSFMAAPADVGQSFEFTIKTKDCGGIVSQCSMTAQVVDNPLCGDLNYSGSVDIIDIIFFINAAFKHGPPPSSAEIADVNGDSAVNILDIIHLINYKFKGGPPPNCL